MLPKTLILVVIIGYASGYKDIEERRPPPDTGLNVKQLIKKYKYPFEEHIVQTKDGYILENHRIPLGRSGSGNGTRPPVVLFPGVFCSSADWVNMGPKKSLGFILADRGYDVWLANYRGTRWSKKHATLNPDVDKKEYWTYSFQQLGENDLSAVIDYILNLTKEEKLFFVGHSQGTTSFFALTSAKPEYNDKIRLAVTLSPVAYANHMTTPLIHLLAKYKDEIEESLEKYQQYEVLPYSPALALAGRIFCQDGAVTQDICAAVLYMAGGYSPDQLNKTMIPVIVSNTPAGASMVQGMHYAQLLLSENFQKYDYGEEKNLQIYGQSTPPVYDLSKVTTPVALYYGSSDPYSVKEDVDRLAFEISNLVAYKYIKGWNHLDVLWGIDVEEIYNHVIELMKQY